MTKLSIIFRTAGGLAPGKELGLGHIYRAVNLAKQLKKHKIFFLVEDYGGAIDIIKKNGFNNYARIKPGINISNDIKSSSFYLKKKKSDFIIIDKFDINNEYVCEVRKYSKAIIIADLNNLNFKGDLVINGFIGFKNGEKINRFKTRCIFGPKYQILSEKFAKKQYLPKKFDLIATFGGFDEKNIIDILLTSLEPYIPKIKSKIILGNATKKTRLIKKFEKKYSRFVNIERTSKNFHKDICESKFGLCSGGITSYEYASLGIPYGIVCQVQHQLKTASVWEKKHIALNLGLVGKSTPAKIDNFLKKILENQIPYSFKRSSLVDGKGAKRVASEILNIH